MTLEKIINRKIWEMELKDLKVSMKY